jgi:hypothetical protein
VKKKEKETPPMKVCFALTVRKNKQPALKENVIPLVFCYQSMLAHYSISRHLEHRETNDNERQRNR